MGEAIAGRAYVDVDIDGIQTLLVEPPATRPHPTIVLARCNMFDHIHDSYSPAVQSWVDHGFAVVLPNYRGTMGFGRRWRDDVLGNPGLTELADLAKVHDWIVANGIADSERIVLNGESWGGYLTLLGLGTQQERWAAGIAEVPVGDFVACYEDVMEPLKAMNRAQFGGAPSDVPEVYQRASPISYVEHLQAPVRVVAGANTPTKPAQSAWRRADRTAALRVSGELQAQANQPRPFFSRRHTCAAQGLMRVIHHRLLSQSC